MKPQDPHCTAHIHEGKDAEFEQEWFREGCTKERLMLNCVFWNDHRCAVSVTLPQMNNNRRRTRPFPFTSYDSVPHVPLANHHRGKWQDLGLWVKQCVTEDKWVETSIRCNPNLRVQKENIHVM